MRAICLKPTDGMTRGTVVQQHRPGHHVPVGDVLGHVFNVIGEPLDITLRGARRSPIGGRSTVDRPAFDTLEPQADMFETGIKVIDLLTPY